jgi:Heparinase II/III-like protein/Heparinase II/III N-terminus
MAFTNFSNSFHRLGLLGVSGLALRKFTRWMRYKSMLLIVPSNHHVALLKQRPESLPADELEKDRDAIVGHADAMLRDENIFFTFPYRAREIERPWEFDPIEKKYWPRRHFTERKLHAHDTPRDVKIVFEINRFKDLPTLGQAAILTGKEEYASEVEQRILSWIEDNPFASSVNWSSALEISIRLIAWTTTLLLLKEAGFTTCDHPKIQRSIYEQACYLAADLGTDKVLPTNHLIGEATGLYCVASLWEFNKNREYARLAQRILEQEIARQTFPDGVTREASSWYHQFVTHFFDLADRIATSQGNPFSQEYKTRLLKMKAFLNEMMVAGTVIRYGDSDDGWVVFLEGNIDRWKNYLFGSHPTHAFIPTHNDYPSAKLIATHIGEAFLFLRAGVFGMGGAGFSSHAHDDFLSPIIYLAGVPILVDPGTFVYSGDPDKRMIYRQARAHNGLVFGTGTGAVPRKQFGWLHVRPDAIIHQTAFNDSEAAVTASYGEWSEHRRSIKIQQTSAVIEDNFLQPIAHRCEWRLHLAPEWIINESAESNGDYHFRTASGDRLRIKLQGDFETISVESYDYSPSYLVAQPGTMLRLSTSSPAGMYAIHLMIDKARESFGKSR